METAAQIEELPPQQWEVLIRSLHGHSRAEIAQDLGVTTDTVGTHRTRVAIRLGRATSDDVLRAARAYTRAGLGKPYVPAPNLKRTTRADFGAGRASHTRLVPVRQATERDETG